MPEPPDTVRPVRALLLCLLASVLFGCAGTPLKKTLALERPVRLGVAGFTVTAPIKSLSVLMEHPPKDLSPEEEKRLVAVRLTGIEEKADGFLMGDLEEEGKVDAVFMPVPETEGKEPEPAELQKAGQRAGVDAVLYGEIPWYGKTRLLYPVLGMSLDIAAETVIIGAATHWNLGLIAANTGFELLTSTPLWFGGAYLFGVAFRPVTVQARIYSTATGRRIWQGSYDRIVSGKFLEKYPESERSKKEYQLEASLANAVSALAHAAGE